MSMYIYWCWIVESDEEFRELLGDVNEVAWQMPAVRSLKQQASALNAGVAKKGESIKNRMTSVLEKTGAQLGFLAGERVFYFYTNVR